MLCILVYFLLLFLSVPMMSTSNSPESDADTSACSAASIVLPITCFPSSIKFKVYVWVGKWGLSILVSVSFGSASIYYVILLLLILKLTLDRWTWSAYIEL